MSSRAAPRRPSESVPASQYPAPVPRDRKILDAAARLFYERGFSGVSVDQIGERAGVTGPAIYRHFKGKEDILTSLFDEALDGLMEATAPTGTTGRERLEEIVAQHARFVVRESELTSIWANQSNALSPSTRRRFMRRTRIYFDRWADAIRDCYPERDDETLEASTHCAISLVNALMTWPHGLREEQADRAVELVVAMSLAAIEAPAGDHAPAS